MISSNMIEVAQVILSSPSLNPEAFEIPRAVATMIKRRHKIRVIEGQ